MKKRVIILLLAILATVGVGFGVWRYILLAQEVARLKTSPAEAAKQEAQSIVDKVKSLIAVPEGELPTVAEVTNVDRLKNNAFFSSAQNGDKVLIFTEAKKAILYRPGENKVIEVSPLTIGTTSATPVAKDVRFVLYNGTTVTGLTKSYEATLKTRVPDAVVVDRDNAKKNDYEKSLLIDLTGAKSDQAKEIAASLGLEVGEFPQGETKPDGADFLIILGADRK